MCVFSNKTWIRNSLDSHESTRMKNILIHSFIADAMALGPHWIYS